MPCRVHVVEEGAEHVNACGRGGGGACARGVCPALQPVGGTGHWALRGGCEGRGTLPSEPRRRGERKTQLDTVSYQFDSFRFRFRLLYVNL